MLIPLHKVVRKLASLLKEADNFGFPYENISIFSPSNPPSELGGYGTGVLTEEDCDESSKWKNDMRRQGPYPPMPDILESGLTPMSTVNEEIPAGVGVDVEGPRTDAQGKGLNSMPNDLDTYTDEPIDMNRDTYTPPTPDDLGSAI